MKTYKIIDLTRSFMVKIANFITGNNLFKDVDGIPESTKKKIILSNKINGSLIIIFIVVLIIDLVSINDSKIGFNTDYLRSILIIGLCSVNILINYFGFFKLTRVLLLFILPFLMVVFIPMTGKVLNEYYFWFPYLPVAASVLPYYLFNDDTEKKWLLITVGFYLILVLLTPNILNFYANPDLDILPIIQENTYFYKLSGGLIFINITLYYIFSLSGKYETELINARNLLQNKNKELERTNTDLNSINATKDKFFHIIGHDLRAPIAQMIQISEFLDENVGEISKADQKKILKALNESSKSGLNLLNNLFNWSLTQTGDISFNPKSLNLNALVEENILLLKESAQSKNIQIINKINSGSYVYADINMLHTIIRNILSNAIKFTYQNGIIKISNKNLPDGNEIYIKDNGKGISKNDCEKIFRIDSKVSNLGTNNEKGTGIGLILCKEFIDYHNGRIWVESKENEGSKFIFFIPSEK